MPTDTLPTALPAGTAPGPTRQFANRLPRPRLPESLGVLRNRDFRLYWAGQAISLSGTWMQSMAQSWLVLGLTSSAFALGLVNFSMAIPTVLLSVFGGVMADRFDKRSILLASQVAMMALAFVLGALVWLGMAQFWHVLLVAFLLGIATAYDLPANQALVPELVEREQISRAIALNSAIFHGSRLIGPAIAGIVIASVGLAGAFFANGLSFVAVIASLLLIRYRGAPGDLRAGGQLNAIRDGLRYVRGEPIIISMLAITVLTSLFVFPSLAIMLPIYVRDVLLLDIDAMAMVMAVSGLGSLIGSIILLTIPRDRQLSRLFAGAALLVLSLSALAWVRWLPLALLATGLLSLGISTAMGLASTRIQEQVRPELRGRTMSLFSLAFMGVIPFSGLAATALADLVGLPIVMQASALLYALGALILWARLRTPSRAVPLPCRRPPQ